MAMDTFMNSAAVVAAGPIAQHNTVRAARAINTEEAQIWANSKKARDNARRVLEREIKKEEKAKEKEDKAKAKQEKAKEKQEKKPMKKREMKALKRDDAHGQKYRKVATPQTAEADRLTAEDEILRKDLFESEEEVDFSKIIMPPSMETVSAETATEEEREIAKRAWARYDERMAKEHMERMREYLPVSEGEDEEEDQVPEAHAEVSATPVDEAPGDEAPDDEATDDEAPGVDRAPGDAAAAAPVRLRSRRNGAIPPTAEQIAEWKDT
jgi:hypothetical protein